MLLLCGVFVALKVERSPGGKARLSRDQSTEFLVQAGMPIDKVLVKEAQSSLLLCSQHFFQPKPNCVGR